MITIPHLFPDGLFHLSRLRLLYLTKLGLYYFGYFACPIFTFSDHCADPGNLGQRSSTVFPKCIKLKHTSSQLEASTGAKSALMVPW